jgi:phosphoenolpyruvate phosphomutase
MKKTVRFRQLLTTKHIEFVMEAHNALSARIVEEAGFKALWAGGLAMSAAMGVRDCNELSWTQVLDTIEFMSDATDIPILLDADTGYGNYNNVRRLIQKLESRDIAAVCIEDKLFPKSNSFVHPEFQELADIEEFCGRIRAAKDAQTDPYFTVIARVEAFIVGLGLDEALKRAEAYRRAGADGILIHSKSSDVGEIASFMRHWKDRCPVVIVPTSYYKTPTSLFQNLGVSLVVWSNHMLRASIMSMQRVAQDIAGCSSIAHAESHIVPVHEVFRLQCLPELNRADKKYLPKKRFMRGYVVNVADSPSGHAGVSTTDAKEPARYVKCSAEEALRGVGIKNIGCFSLDASGAFSGDADCAIGERWKVGLWQLLGQLNGPAIIIPNTTFFDTNILEILRDAPGDIVIVVKTRGSASRYENIASAKSSELVSGEREDDTTLNCLPENQGKEDDWAGLMKVSGKGIRHLKRAVAAGWRSAMPANDLLQAASRDGARVRLLYMNGHSSCSCESFREPERQ